MHDPQALDLLMRLNAPLPVFSQSNREFLVPKKERTNHGVGETLMGWLSSNVPGAGDSGKETKRNAIDEMNKSLIGTLQKLSIEFKELSPTTALEFISKTEEQSFFPIGGKNGAKLPSNIDQTVTNTDEVIALLNYVVGQNKADPKIEIDTLPLLLTRDKK